MGGGVLNADRTEGDGPTNPQPMLHTTGTWIGAVGAHVDRNWHAKDTGRTGLLLKRCTTTKSAGQACQIVNTIKMGNALPTIPMGIHWTLFKISGRTKTVSM